MTQPLSAELELEKLDFINIAYETYDLRSDFLDMRITESIGSEFIKGWVTFNDLIGISELYKGYSGGYLRIKFRTNPDFPYYEKIFWIYKVGDDEQLENTHQYNNRNLTFFFASPGLSLNLSENYSKVYKNKKPHEIVDDVVVNMLDSTLASVDTTRDLLSLVVPYSWSPIGIINHCIKKSFSSTNMDTGYLFFENSAGYHYTTLSQLLKQDPKYNMVLEVPEDKFRDKYFANINKIISYKTIKHIDLIESWMSHRFGASAHYIDFDDIRWKESVHTFDEAYLNKTVNLGTKTVTSNVNSNGRAYHFDYFGGFQDYKLQNYSRYNLMQDNHLSITAPGDSRKLAGDIIDIRWPSKEKTLQRNEGLDGNWIISSLTHSINNKLHYVQEMRIVKDALKTNEGPSFNTGLSNP